MYKLTVAHICNANPQETEAEALSVQVLPGLHSESPGRESERVSGMERGRERQTDTELAKTINVTNMT